MLANSETQPTSTDGKFKFIQGAGQNMPATFVVDRGLYSSQIDLYLAIKTHGGVLRSDKMSLSICQDGILSLTEDGVQTLEIDIAVQQADIVAKDLFVNTAEGCSIKDFTIENTVGITNGQAYLTDKDSGSDVLLKFDQSKPSDITFDVKASTLQFSITKSFKAVVGCFDVGGITSTYIGSRDTRGVGIRPATGPLMLKIILDKAPGTKVYKLNEYVRWDVDHNSDSCSLEQLDFESASSSVYLG